MEALIIKYIVGEADASEQEQALAWIASHPDNRKTYEHYLSIWNNSKMPDSMAIDPDIETAWQQFVSQRDTQIQNTKTFRPWFKTALAAAVLIMVVFSSWWVFMRNDMVELHTITQLETFVLPDQSVVTLNAQSKIKFENSFNEQGRWVSMEGEAFFEVTKNPSKPFVVSVKDIEVRVLGTSFNVRSDDKITEIVVEIGSVKVSRAGKEYVLEAQDKLLFNRDKNSVVMHRVNNQLYQYYRTNMFVCEHTPVAQLIETLTQAYKIKIEVSNEDLMQQYITGKFPRTDDVATILETVAHTLNANLIKDDNVYILQRD